MAPHQSPPEQARGYADFRGTVGRTSSVSEPWWPAERTPRSEAPNIVVVLVDDMGFSDIGPFGAEIETPNIDALAQRGLRLSNYHTTPVCSPARAALLTGLNPHRAGYGSVANSDPGYPGLRLELADDVLTLPEILRDSGYATYAVGKWHLVRDANMGPGRSRDSWPVQRGFDSYYGSLEGLNSFFHPNQLISDNSVVDVDEYPDDYYVTDDLTDRAIGQIKALRAQDRDKPFFLYFAHIAMHGPHQVKESDLAKYRGRYAEGWDVVRQRRFERQIDEGLFDPDTPMAERNTTPGYDAPLGETLAPDEQRRFQRYQEVYAAMVHSVDQSVGRVVETLTELGELDNTIIVFTSDNGGTAEGGPVGTRSYFSQFVHGPVPPDWERDVPHDEDLIGSAAVGVHYPRGWGQASNTPFRFYKGQTFAGGVRVPFVISWPDGLRREHDDSGVRRQYSYVTDVAPTLLDLAGIPTPPERFGRPAQERDGVSAASFLRDRSVSSSHTEQYAEFGGHRGFYRDGWKLVSLHTNPAKVDDPAWELYDVTADPAETTDVAARHPDRVAELAQAWEETAWRNTVFPLFDSPADQIRRRPDEDRYSDPARILAGTPTLERYRSSRLIAYRDFDIDVELEGWTPSDEGVLVAHGDRQGGYLLYIEDAAVHLVFNSYGRSTRVSAPLPDAVSAVTVRAAATPQVRWDLSVEITRDGQTSVVAKLPDQFQLVGMAPWTGISVGLDARGPVDPDLRARRGVFRFGPALRAVTYRPGPVRVPGGVRRAIDESAEHHAD
ncbi:sulfatase-like hydrolase/transferase [Gordonia sp. SID5947]|uniref:arylsulfatase n=1 Tax=Gordonia sp. SID5947 TaxID=2690315 RepID=UPI001368D959|nr:arylsulfatase [Gordonia sp. SID5947]MYR07714.1 sulfatase-like hydrolase/transferase [Gordonia sp. SID5947]